MGKTAVVLGLGLMSASAYAVSVHLQGGANSEPTFIDNGLTLTALGSIVGLGNIEGLVTLNATANPTAVCVNPGVGGDANHQPPGQNPAPITVSGSATIDPDDFAKNGNYPFLVTTNPPASPVPGSPDCPNTSWDEVITDLAFTSAEIIVEQPLGDAVLLVTCSIDPPSGDGQIGGGDVVCVQIAL